MTAPSSALAPPDDNFLRALARARERILLLDYDGTLAPFRVERLEAQPYDGVREALQAIIRSAESRIVIVTGRELRVVTTLLGIDPLPEVWASHGWERRSLLGGYRLSPLPPPAKLWLEEARRNALDAGLGSHLEEKPTSLALHWRGLSDGDAATLKRRCLSTWRDLAEAPALDLHPFDGGVELRVPGRDKGTAVREILAESDGEAMVAYLGDDNTDEDAFAALPKGGLGVLVRSEVRPTAATAWLRPPEELLWFLRRWLQAAS